jgi:lysophospholipase L1-like esterase
MPPPVAELQRLSVRQRAELAVVPFDDSTTTRVRALFRAGAATGQRPDVFAKLGDSITESGSFLHDVGHGWYELGPWSRLEPVIRYFRRARAVPSGESNSFNRPSRAAEAGWTTTILLHGGDNSRLEEELAQTRPAFAILMIGTNDAERSNLETYTRELNEIVRRVLAHNIVLVLSTIPDQLSSPTAGALGRRINDVIRRVAFEQHLPLIDYWAAMQGLPHQGIDPDNVHPSIYMGANGNNAAAGVFTDQALMFGYNMRNLTTLLMLERLLQTLEIRP